jgi:hypothetical protein
VDRLLLFIHPSAYLQDPAGQYLAARRRAITVELTRLLEIVKPQLQSRHITAINAVVAGCPPEGWMRKRAPAPLFGGAFLATGGEAAPLAVLEEEETAGTLLRFPTSEEAAELDFIQDEYGIELSVQGDIPAQQFGLPSDWPPTQPPTVPAILKWHGACMCVRVCVSVCVRVRVCKAGGGLASKASHPRSPRHGLFGWQRRSKDTRQTTRPSC